MKKGFDMKQKDILSLHNQALYFDRLNTTCLLQIQTKKKLKPTDLYGLPTDVREIKVTMTQEDIEKLRYKLRKTVPKEEKKTREEILKL